MRSRRLWLPFVKERKIRLRFIPARSIVTVSTTSAAGCWKLAMLALRLPNPQVEQADMAWEMASNQLRPHILRAMLDKTVRPA